MKKRPLFRNRAAFWRLCLLLAVLVGCTPLPTAPRRVTVVVDGERITLETQAATVREVLTEANVTLENLDYVTPAEVAALQEGMTIQITRVVQWTETITETIPFGRQTVRDATIPQGQSRLLESGQAGVREYVYRITSENNVEVERTLIRQGVSQPPQDEILLVGTRAQVLPTVFTGTLVYLHNQDAWVMRNSNNNRRRLTTGGDLDGRVFTLSPDGARLLFTRVVTSEEHINALWLINTVEADAEPFPLGVNDVLWADWDPEGERIAWTTAEVVERAPGWRGQNDLHVAVLSPRDTLISPRQVIEPEAGGGYGWWGTRYAWSPDGERLAYSTPDEVGVISWVRRERQTLATFPAYRTYSSWAWNPALTWSADGRFIGTVLHGPNPHGGDPEESPYFDLWVLEASGAYSAALASEVGMWATPVYDHVGGQLTFGRAQLPYQSQLSGYRLCSIDRDGSNSTCFYPPEGEPGLEIPLWIWNPNGQRLAFIQRGDIYFLERAIGNAAPITDGGQITALDWK